MAPQKELGVPADILYRTSKAPCVRKDVFSAEKAHVSTKYLRDISNLFFFSFVCG